MSIDKLQNPKVNQLVDTVNALIDQKQDALVSGINIKTINNTSLLGSGNIDIQGGGEITVDIELSTTSENPVQNKVITNALADLSSNVNMESYLDMIISGNYSDLPIVLQSSYNGDLDDIIEGVYQ